MSWLILAVGSCWHTRVRPDKPYPHPDSLIDGLAAMPVSGVVEDSDEMSGIRHPSHTAWVAWVVMNSWLVLMTLQWFCRIDPPTLAASSTYCFDWWFYVVSTCFNMFQLFSIPPLHVVSHNVIYLYIYIYIYRFIDLFIFWMMIPMNSYPSGSWSDNSVGNLGAPGEGAGRPASRHVPWATTGAMKFG